jgi:multiple sugar transport system permease protein
LFTHGVVIPGIRNWVGRGVERQLAAAIRSCTAGEPAVVEQSIWSKPLRRREAINGYLFVLPWVLGFLAFTAGPFFYGFYISLTNYDVLTPPRWLGLAHYETMFLDDPSFWQCVYNTIFYSGLSVVPRIILALLLALLLNQKVRGITVFRTLFYLPSIIPSVASIALFLFIMHDRFGLLNEVLYQWFGIEGPKWFTSPAWTKPALIVWSMWGLGGSMIIYLAGLQGVPEELHEAASIDGAGPLRRFFSVTLPLISPTLFFVLVMGIIGSFQVFTPVVLLRQTSGNMAGPMDSLLMWVVYIYMSGFTYFHFGYASAMAWILFLVLIVLTIVQFRVSSRWVYYGGEVERGA